MFNRCVGFVYDDTRYITVLDGDYLQETFSGGNAVPAMSTMSQHGLMLAATKAWKVKSPMVIPCVEDAVVQRLDANLFTVEGFLSVNGVKGIYTLTENSQTWEPVEPEGVEESPIDTSSTFEEVVDTVAEVKESVAVESSDMQEEVTELSAEEVREPVVEEVHEPIEDAMVIEPTEPEEVTVPENEDTTVEEPKVLIPAGTQLRIGRAHVKPISIGATLRRPSLTTPTVSSPSVQMGVTFGHRMPVRTETVVHQVPEIEEVVTQTVEVPANKTAREIVDGASQSNPSYVYVVNKDITEKAAKEAEDAADVFHVKSLSGKELLGDVSTEDSSVPAYTPVRTVDDFDTEQFLSSLSEDQRKVLEQIPVSCLVNTISEFTTKEIDRNEVLRAGANYCVSNKWHIQGDWYFIDVTPHMSRFFYYEKDNLAVEIPLSIFKKWRLYKEANNG